MRKELARLLAELVDTNQQVERELNARFTSYPMPRSAFIQDFERFQSSIASLYQHLCKFSLGDQTGNEHLRARAFHLLAEEYGQNVRIHAFDIARSGAEGGLLAVLRTLTRLVQKDLFYKRARALVDAYWRSTTADQLVSDAKEYLQVYGHLLPGEMTEGAGTLILANYRAVLLEHPNLIRGIRQAVRR